MLSSGRYYYLKCLTIELLNPRPLHACAIQLDCPLLEELHITAYCPDGTYIEDTFSSFPQRWQHLQVIFIGDTSWFRRY